ncbi:hypothetical protein QFZ24_010068 [Streptomyces phaeochromogenes]|jgi:hypothetical protein|uniref:DUF6003 family protein n=1 Tax=Streptomyces phaeochromogenes TaxID=1923 RepID=UPI00278F53ED|nr:DUF6003 family protein [Streptomyces phaeochromogenes]MDQ0956059.1 hypothetical protein [Streptomyces phaeochromogenes]
MPEAIPVDKELLETPAPALLKQGNSSSTRKSNQALQPTSPERKTPDMVKDHEAELMAYRRCMESRDELIRKAKAAGLTEVRIAQLTGHSRNTVRAALGHRGK